MTSELKIDLTSFGYADGGYMSKCSHCKETFLGAKRSWSCKPCAIKKILEPKITRAVPDVPELVRYRLNSLGELVYSEKGQYVLHSQAAEIIAAKDKEIEKQKRLTKSAEDFLYEVSRKLGKAEGKLAQYEDQEIVGYVTDRVKTRDGSHCFMSLNKAYPYINAVYTSPAPAADLKAENERLREAVKPLTDHAKNRDVESPEWLDTDTVRMPVTIGELRAALNVEASNDKV